MTLHFDGEFDGWHDIGAMHVAFIETHNETGDLETFPGVLIQSRIEGSDVLDVFLVPGSKDTNPHYPYPVHPGLCERALYGSDTVYQFRAVMDEDGAPLSDWVRCDLAQPIDAPGGFVHKSGFVKFTLSDAPPDPEPPVPGDCDECPIRADLEARNDAMSACITVAQRELEQAQSYSIGEPVA